VPAAARSCTGTPAAREQLTVDAQPGRVTAQTADRYPGGLGDPRPGPGGDRRHRPVAQRQRADDLEDLLRRRRHDLFRRWLRQLDTVARRDGQAAVQDRLVEDGLEHAAVDVPDRRGPEISPCHGIDPVLDIVPGDRGDRHRPERRQHVQAQSC
jgi:hypothetical protein